MPDWFLRGCEGGANRTYAYLLLDHLRWLVAEGLATERVTFPDLERYMAALGAEHPGPFSRSWPEGRRPYERSTLSTAAACLKRFYLFQGSQGLGREVAEAFRAIRLPSRADRRRMFLGHVVTAKPTHRSWRCRADAIRRCRRKARGSCWWRRCRRPVTG
jgi:hypothetical protein